jgi:two-component system response regulator YesN
MIKLLIVDDEPLLRIALRNVVNWSEHGYTIVDDVTNGAEAIEAIKKEMPDLVLTDIKMPVMNGIELIQYIQENGLPIKVIVLSNFNDFDFVKEALLRGASDYLLKANINPDTLFQVIQAARAKPWALRKASDAANNEDKYIEEIKLNIEWLRSELLKRIFSGSSIEPAQMEAKIKLYELNLREARYVVLTIKMDKILRVINSYTEKELEMINDTVFSILKQLIDDGLYFAMSPDTYVLMIYVNDLSETSFFAKVIDLAGRIQNSVSRLINFTVTTGISDISTGIGSIRQTYEQSLCAIDYRFYAGIGQIIHYGSIKQNGNKQRLDDRYSDCLREVRGCMDRMDVTRIGSSLVNFSQSLKNEYFPGCLVKQFFVDMLLFINSSIIKEYQLDVSNVMNDSMSKDVFECDTLDEIERYVQAVMSELLQFIKKEKGSTTNELIVQALSYINAHYNNKITLVSMAKELAVNSSYLSRLFLQETNTNFIHYLTELRVRKAKKMLTETNLSIADVSMHVGYDNPKYFDNVFKKSTGTNPNNFRKESKQM